MNTYIKCIFIVSSLTLISACGGSRSKTEPDPIPVSNLSPVANTPASLSTTGNEVVMLDGSSSIDPDGNITNYQWLQTSGSSVVINNAEQEIASFTAPNSLTELGFSLTVTDNRGATHSSSVLVSITNTSRSFSSYPDLNPLLGLDNPSLAYGLTDVNDWYVALPFLDIMKMSREWMGHLPSQWGGMSFQELDNSGYLDEHGWPISIPSELESIGVVFDWEGNDYGQGEDRKGEYLLTYDGEGVIQLFGIQNAQIMNEEPGSIVFNINNNQGSWGFKIYSTDTNSNGNYIRNIKIIRQDRIALYNSGAIFNPDWLNNIHDSRQVRFMRMMGIKNSTISSWSERREVDDFTWSGRTPIEVLVRLANEIGADPWLNVPFHADDVFVRQFAIYVRDNLDSNLVAHVEFSNEVWNWSLQQTQDSHSMGINLWSLDPNNAGPAYANYYGKRASEVMAIWTEEFGPEAESRLMRIAGTHKANSWLSEQILLAPIWEENDPNNYIAPHVYFDALAPASYFGGEVIRDENLRNAMIGVMDDPDIDNYDFHYRLLKGEVYGFENSNSTLPALFGNLYSQRSVADNYDLKLIAYEGGQHVHHSAYVNIPEADLLRLQEHLEGFVRSEQMATLYEELWNEWMLVGTGPFMHFVDHGAPTRWGSWGLRASLSDSNPRLNLLEQLNSNTEAWWESRGGPHFRHGSINYGTASDEILVGTPSEDYLIGGAGDDTFYPGPGNDGINGGTGNDIVLFRGNRSEYSLLVEKNGYRIVGPDGSDYVFDIEELQFEDTKVYVSTIGN